MLNKKTKLLLYLITILSFIGSCISYFFMPEQIPIHWNINGSIDNYTNKIMILLFGLLPVLFILLLDKLPKLDPRKQSYLKHAKAYHIFCVAIIALLTLCVWITILSGLGYTDKINFLVPAAIGILFLIIGNYMPTIKSNFFYGIKNPWTLKNEDTWRKTNRMGGYFFIVAGLLLIAAAFYPAKFMFLFFLCYLFLFLIGINFYSYYIYKKMENSKKAPSDHYPKRG